VCNMKSFLLLLLLRDLVKTVFTLFTAFYTAKPCQDTSAEITYEGAWFLVDM